MSGVLLLLAAALSGAPDGERPRHNAAFVPDDDGTIRQLAAAAVEAAQAGDPALAADRLQEIVAGGRDTLLAVRGRELFVSARRWATLMLLSELPPFGRETLAAWRAAFDVQASAAIRGAFVAGDAALALDLLDRHPASTLAPATLLALCDRALQRGDADEAWTFLDRFEEHVPPSEAEKLADPAVEARRAHLHAHPPAAPAGWPTEGGDFTRARLGDPIPDRGLEKIWDCPFLDESPLEFDEFLLTAPRLQSPTLPSLAVCDATRLYVHMGGAVAAISRATGKLLFFAPDESAATSTHVSLAMITSPGSRCATIDEGILYFDRLLFEPGRFGSTLLRNELTAYDVEERRVLWSRVLDMSDGKDEAHAFFRGAPAIAGDRLLVYGGVREGGMPASRKEEAHLFCFDKRTGRLLWRRFLGYGETEAPGAFPPQSGTSVAVARGVAVVVTGIGVAAAVDARSGEALWLLRYDRLRPRDRDRLAEHPERRVAPVSAWMREPPRIVGDRVFLAPFDSDSLYGCYLRGLRRPGGEFHVVLWDRHRAEGHRSCLFEYLGGIAGGRVACVGRPDPRDLLGETVVSMEARDGTRLAYARFPADGIGEEEERRQPEVYGFPAVAGETLLVPTRSRIHRFLPFSAPRERREDEIVREIPALAPLDAYASGGNLLASGGFLYMISTDRVVALGAPR